MKVTKDDTEMKGPEFLRNICRAAGLCIRQKTRQSDLDLLKELVRGFGLDPERVLVKDAIAEGHRGVVVGDPTESQAQALLAVLREKRL